MRRSTSRSDYCYNFANKLNRYNATKLNSLIQSVSATRAARHI